jgi:hypothetical protein
LRSVHDLERQQRVAAQLEEVVVESDARQAQHVRDHGGESLL